MKGAATSPLTDPMKTIRPRPARSNGSSARVTAIWPTTLTSNCRRSAATGRYSSGPATAMPALLTSPANPAGPTAAPIVSAAAATSRSLVMSNSTGVNRADACPASAEPSTSRRTPAKTRQPSRSSRNAHAAPMPDEAPVTSTADGGCASTR